MIHHGFFKHSLTVINFYVAISSNSDIVEISGLILLTFQMPQFQAMTMPPPIIPTSEVTTG